MPRLIILFPIMLLVVFPWAATLEVENLQLAVIYNDHSQTSLRLLHQVEASDYFRLTQTCASYEEALALMEKGDADLILEIPKDFEKERLLGRTAEVLIAANAVNGVYYLRRAKGKAEGTVFVQGAGVGRIVVEELLPKLAKNGPDVNVVYITSRELFEALPAAEQEKILPAELFRTAMGITDFTLPTLDCWINSQAGRRHTLYPHRDGRFLASASAAKVYAEAGLDGEHLFAAVCAYVENLKRAEQWL